MKYDIKDIFLATIEKPLDKFSASELSKALDNPSLSKGFSDLEQFITLEEYDIFAKEENGYRRFFSEGSDFVVGDNSDGKGIIKNIVPVEDYYNILELSEMTLTNGEVALVVSRLEPLEQYNIDYNKK